MHHLDLISVPDNCFWPVSPAYNPPVQLDRNALFGYDKMPQEFRKNDLVCNMVRFTVQVDLYHKVNDSKCRERA